MTKPEPTPSATCRVLSSRRIFPVSPPPNGPQSTNLSIIDASIARFAPCAAIWLYDASDSSQDTNFLFGHLERSLGQTLNDYRHFAGQLRWASPRRRGFPGASPRLGRPEVVYGTAADDPGVELVTAYSDCALGELVPGDDERRGDKRVWVATGFPQDELLPSCELAFAQNLGHFEGLPGASVQLTAFRCGGWAVGVRMTHCLGDAVCLVEFVKNWAEKARRLFRSETSLIVGAGAGAGGGVRSQEPVFAPGLLDRHAGDTNLPEPDGEKVALARSLPMHRYDWWATDAPGYPLWATASSEATKPSDEELQEIRLTPSTAPPWETWDPSAPVEHVQIRFRAEQVRQMKAAAQASLLSAGPSQVISRLDTLLAHMWILINRARQLDKGSEEVYMDITLGLRTRVCPPLPETFVGSPILLGHVALPGSAAGSSDVGSVAMSIRRMMALFTPHAVSAYMHEVAYEVSPQRLWQGFLGKNHTMVTAWTRAGVYDVEFTGGKRPRYVQARMPRMDGLLQVLDVGENGDFDVSLALEKGSMARLLEDGGLWLW